jgi:nitroreductase
MIDAILGRRSIRRFTRETVSDEVVDRILDAGRWAPSGLNNQPWRFAVIRDSRVKERLASLTRYGSIIRSADVILAVFFDQNTGYDRTKDLQAIGACIQNMLLAIHGSGLGGVWLGEILKSGVEVGSLLEAPDSYEFMAAVALGYPEGKAPGAPGRKSIAELVFSRR